MRGQVRRLIRDALLACYDGAGLRELAATGLGVELAHVAGGEDLAEIAWNLVAWTEQNGRTADLLRAASLDRPQAAEEWRRLATLVGARPVERTSRVEYDAGWERRIEEKIDRLAEAVGKLDVRLTVLENRVQTRGELPPHMIWIAVLILAAATAAGMVAAVRLP